MTVILAVAVIVLLVVAEAIGPDNPILALRVARTLAEWIGPVLTATFAWMLLRGRLVRRLQSLLVEMVGPALVRAMPPSTVLEALFARIYGDTTDHHDVIVGVLGGAGRDQHGRDTAVSSSTTAEFRFRALDDTLCFTEAIWTHEYSGVRQAHKFVVFVTADPMIARLVASERIHPLFEVWVVEDEDQLEDFVPNLRNNFDIGISYVDESGDKFAVEPRAAWGEEVALRSYDQFVRLPENVDRKDLRIVEFDLWDLADLDHVVARVESMTFRATAISELNLGFFTWSPPHPCYVKKVVFDVAEFAPPGQSYSYRVVPFTMKTAALSIAKWTREHGRIEVPLESWMLQGHGVTIFWRVVDDEDIDS